MKGGKDSQETKIGAKLLFVRDDKLTRRGQTSKDDQGAASLLMASEFLPHRGG